MSLEFLCPKGHKIRCPEDRAGQAARCPKCGVKFLIPDGRGNGAAESPPPDSKRGAAGVKQTGENGIRSARDQIEFLCPNGHRLHGPRNLQGYPGQCPECGSKFRIPTYDEPSESAEAKDQHPPEPQEKSQEPPPPETGLGEKADSTDLQVTLEPVGDSAVNLLDLRIQDESSRIGSHLSGGKLRTAIMADGAARLHPLCDLVSRLWAKKSPAAQVELHFANGEKLLPERFVKGMSQATHGLFAVKESDGSYTLTAVAWDCITRVSLRHLGELPEEMRE
jgi:hypothetical protein